MSPQCLAMGFTRALANQVPKGYGNISSAFFLLTGLYKGTVVSHACAECCVPQNQWPVSSINEGRQ